MAAAAGPEPMPSYAQLVQRGWGSAVAAARGCSDCGWGLARRGLAEHAHLAPPELLLGALGALGWTALRSAATARLFRPLALRCRLAPKDAAKLPESAWKFLFYLGAWSYSAYLLFGTNYTFFHDPPSAFYDWASGMAVPRDIAAAYLLQGSFYGHSIYATLYMDTWRRDSAVMLLHHVVTLLLIVSSYAFRYHNVGILVLFLHDVSDVQLEFTKLNVYFKSRGGAAQRAHALLADLGCVLVPPLLVPTQGPVRHVPLQPALGPRHPLLFLLQCAAAAAHAHESLLVPVHRGLCHQGADGSDERTEGRAGVRHG
ncbi:ceramide synthase 1 isoform X3 [Sorex fumeus]|uniref:ceramide synthase 1 isoform X3 n=1 Tax=Sorex fumeus TaxID=62283 RepID=UPI0024AD16A7|nr:ceramide synthase 1 isoform X3 [Sorex fumeus]